MPQIDELKYRESLVRDTASYKKTVEIKHGYWCARALYPKKL